MFDQTCPISHYLGSLLGAIEVTTLWAFLCRVGYFDAQKHEASVIQLRAHAGRGEGSTYLHLWKNVTNSLHGIKSQTNLHSSRFPLFHLWKILHKNFKPTLSG